MRRRVLLIATTALIVAAGAVAAVPFLVSLGPNDKARASLPRVDFSSLPPGSSQIVSGIPGFELSGGWRLGLFAVRLNDGRLSVWEVPLRNGMVGMPNRYWWDPAYECHDFGAPAVDGRIDETKAITCHDKPLPQWGSQLWRWDLHGRSLAERGHVEAMIPANGSMEGSYFVYGKSS